MNANNKSILDSVIYSYSTTTNQLEEENRVLRDTLEKMKAELDKFKQPPLMVCEVYEAYGDNALIKIPNGNQFSVNVSAECPKLRPGEMVLAEQKNLTIIRKIPSVKVFNVDKFVIIEKPTVTWADVGGLEHQVREIKEVIELPLLKPELFVKVGIEPPKGVLLYGPPGTGKTLLAKAVASSTNSTFIGVVASELVQKFIGEGAKLVKEIFELAREKAPSVIFIDEIDALAATRMEIGTSGEREVNRTFMQLLAELDGFKPLDNVKVIGATNRKDILDPAITRPGRLDRLINVPLPEKDARQSIFSIHSSKMKLDPVISIQDITNQMENFSGAEIRAVCTEAGYFAIRENRFKILKKDLERAIEKVKESESKEGKDYMKMFG
ncbi:AAA family ATPase [Candidatus Woesearchaeota archaeon]|nr:AAA family ATPase [Candidatus Woesearchaeota archaeon]